MTIETDFVFELGKSLADALDESDIIGRWMSHHLADLVMRSEAHPTDQDLIRETREVILRLWEHKAGGRFKTRPFEYVEPVLAALARLEPDPPPWAHFRAYSSEDLPSAHDMAGYPVIATACDMDREFGRLVRLAVAFAAQSALDKEEPWVVAATAVAGTEVDDVVQQLQRWIDHNPASLSEQSESDSNHLEESTNPPGKNSNDERGSLDGGFAGAFKSTIARCMQLLERFDNLVPVVDAVVNPPKPDLAHDRSEGFAESSSFESGA